jgi:hypothetical protein
VRRFAFAAVDDQVACPRLSASGWDRIGFAVPCPMLGQRSREVLEELVREIVLGRRGRHDTGGSHDILAVGKWLVDPCFAEQIDPRAERRHCFEVFVGLGDEVQRVSVVAECLHRLRPAGHHHRVVEDRRHTGEGSVDRDLTPDPPDSVPPAVGANTSGIAPPLRIASTNRSTPRTSTPSAANTAILRVSMLSVAVFSWDSAGEAGILSSTACSSGSGRPSSVAT